MQSSTLATGLRRRGSAILLLALAAGAPVGLSACGGGKSEGDVEALLNRAFRQSVKSADVKMDAQIKVDGLPSLSRPVRIQANGPYVSSAGRSLPKLDLDLNVGASGAGQTVQSGLLSTGDRAFVKFGGAFYEQPQASVAAANRSLSGRTGGRSSLRSLGLHPRRWVVDAKSEGDEKVGGVNTEHVSGRLDVRALFSDLNGVVQRSGNTVGGVRPGLPRPLSKGDLDQLAKIVKSPTFDVYVGKDDQVIRRISANLQVTVPARDRSRTGGIKGGSLRFSLELARVNGGQSVRAPAKARPISDLSKQLGGLGSLGGAGALGGAGGSGGSAPPAGAGGQGTNPGTGGATGPAAPGGADPQSRRRSADCLDKAKPDDTAALGRCAQLLKR